jgi:hypothetical protein
MKSSISYKNCLIRGESFQLTQSSGWIPRYTLTRQDARNKWNGTPSHHDRLDQVFWTENEADKFALQDAMRWIDENPRLQS